MRKFLISVLCLIFSVSILSLFASCDDSNKNQGNEQEQTQKYTSLLQLTPTKIQNGYCAPTFNKSCLGVDKFLLNGFPISQGISMHPGNDEDAAITYDISNYDYDLFVATIGKNDQQQNCNVRFFVYADGVKKFDSGNMKEADMQFVSVDIKGVKELTIAVNNGGDSNIYDECTWGYPTLINEADFAIEKIESENVDYCVLQGTNPITEETSAIVTYNTGTFKRVKVNELNVKSVNTSSTGKQTIELSYKDFDFSKEILVCQKNSYIKLAEADFKEFVSYFPRRMSGLDSDDGTPFAIAGKLYNSGIGLHPVSSEKAAYITLEVQENQEYRLHAVLGKTRKAIKNEVVFKIYKDSEVIYSSGILLAGQVKEVDLEIKNATEIKIEVDSGDDEIDYDCSGIADAFLYSATGESIVTVEDYLTLTKLTPSASVNGYVAATINQACLAGEGDRFMLSGFPISAGISMHAGTNGNASLTYDLSKYDYDLFTATIGKNNQQAGCYVEFFVYVDGEKKYESGKMKEDDLRLVSVNIAGAKSLRLEISDGGDGINSDEVTWAYPTIGYSSKVVPTDIKVENVDYVLEKGSDITNEFISAIVTYNTGCFERVSKQDISFSEYDANKTGKQEVKVKYKNCESKFDVIVLEKSEFIKICDANFDEFVSYFPQREVGLDADDETNFAISGIRYKNGIGIHPKADDTPAKLTLTLSGEKQYKLHAVLGKTRKVCKGKIVFKILCDGNEVYNSGEIAVGDSVTVDLDIAGAQNITFVVEGGSDGIAYDCAGIADAFLYAEDIEE